MHASMLDSHAGIQVICTLAVSRRPIALNM
jgi:hypothetical protein